MSPDLVEAVIQQIDRLRRAGLPTGSGAYLVPNVRGGRISRQCVAKIVREAAEAATAAVEAKGLPPLSHVTPHTLRRTYISIALLAQLRRARAQGPGAGPRPRAGVRDRGVLVTTR